MPEIRINTLSLADSTTLDDFFAIDGSNNNTRKLSAHSPVLGGNLTVSGGTITGGSSGLSLVSSGSNQNITLVPNGSGGVLVNNSRNGQSVLRLTNSDGGVGAFADLEVAINGATTALYMFGSGYTTSGRYVQGSTLLDTNGTGGLAFGSLYGNISWYMGGNNLVMRLSATNNNLIINSASDTGEKLQVTGTAKITSTLTVGGNLTVSGAANVGNLLTVTGSGTETGVATAKVGASALGGIPRVNLINATNAVNGKYGDIINTSASGNGAFQFRFIDDAITAATAVLSITGRQGATDSFVTAPGTGAHTFGTTNTVTMTNGVLATTGAGTIGGNLTVSGGTLAVTPSANDATATLKGRATGTNQLATSSRGSNVTLVNLDTTDNNCEAIAFQNSNELAIASIVAQNVSHTGRTGKLYVNISNGAAPAEALNIAADKTVTLAGNLTVSGTGTIGNQLKVTNATVPDLWLQNTSGGTSAYRNILLRQNSDNTFKFLSISDAGVLTRDNIITGSNDTGAIGIGAAPGAGVNSLTVAGNLTVSGTSGVTATDLILGTSGPSTKSSLSARAPRQGLVFDGTAGATVSVPAFGTSDFTISGWVNPNSLAAVRPLFSGASGNFYAYISTNGILVINKLPSGTVASTGTVTAGRSAHVAYTRSGTTGTWYINGVAAGTGTDASDYTTGINAIGGSGFFGTYMAGSLFPLILNRALSASEVASLYEAGAPSGADYNSASNTAYATATGATLTVGGSASTSQNLGSLNLAGKRIRYDLNITAIDAGATVRVYQLNAGATDYVELANYTTTGARTLEFTYLNTTLAYFRFYVGVTGSGSATIAATPVYRLGLLLAPDAAQAGGGLVWYDTSGNAANISWTSGVSWNVPSSRVLGGNWTNTGNLTVSGTGTSSVGGTIAGYNQTVAWDGGPNTTNPAFAIGTGAGSTRDLFAFGNGSRIGLLRGYHDGGGTVEWNFGRYITGTFNSYFKISGSSTTGDATISGNLTVSGTDHVFGPATNTVSYVKLTRNGSVIGGLSSANTQLTLFSGSTPSEQVSLYPSGGLAIGSGHTDPGAGNLQVKGTGTSTFAGNLTVSGTGTSSVAGNLGVGMTSPGSRLDVIASTPTLGSATAKGTLNVGTVDAGVADSGGSITFSGSQNVAGGNIRVLGAIAGLKTTTDLSSGYLAFYASASGSVTEYMRLFANGNLFVGASPVDSSNGKLQLATHTTSAGGIGFGADVALFHRATGVGLTLSSVGSTTPYFTLDANGTNVLDIFGLSSDVYFDQKVAGKSLFFRTNGATLALTLDSSQNATFAKDIFLGTSGPSVKSSLSFRAPRQGLVFDTTANATVASVAAFGTSDFTIAAIVRKDSLAAAKILIGGQSNSFGLTVNTNGTVITSLVNVADNTASTGTISAGKTAVVVYSRSGTTGTYYINGVAAGTTTDSRNYSVAFTSIGGAPGNVAVLDGSLSVLAYNRALSAAEVVALYESGAPSGADYGAAAKPASNTNMLTTAQSQMDSGWTTVGTATLSGGQGILGTTSNDALLIDGFLTAAKKYRVTLTIVSGSTVKMGWAFAVDPTVGTTPGTYTIEVETRAVGGIPTRLGFYSTGNAVIDNVSVFPIGLLLAPDAAQAGGGLVWYDTSGNAANISWTSGVSWNVPTSGNVTSGTALNLRAGGTNQNITLTPSGTGNVIAGNSFRVGGTAPADSLAGYTSIELGFTGHALFGGTNDNWWTTNAYYAAGAWKRGANNLVAAINANAGDFIFKQAGAGAPDSAITWTDAMTLYRNGNLLLGTTIDGGQKLQVNGTASISNALSVGPLAPGVDTASHALTAIGPNTGWFTRISSIYDANYTDQYITINGTLTGTRASPTFTGAATGGGFIKVDGNSGNLIFGRFGGGAGQTGTTGLTIASTGDATFAGKVRSNGTGFGVGADSDANTPVYALASINGTFGALIKNSNTGSSAFAGVTVEADSGAAALRQYSTAHGVWAGKTLLTSPSGGTGLVLLTNGAGDNVDIYTNATLAATFDTSQNATFAKDIFLGTSGPSVRSTLSARAPRQGLVFDGTAGADVNVAGFGTRDFTASFFVNPTLLASSSFLCAGDAAFTLYIQTNATVRIGKRYVGDGTASTGTITYGKWNHIVYSRTGTTGTYYINGIAAGTTTDSFDYSGTITFIGRQYDSSQYYSGPMGAPLIYNRALSAAEVVALYEAGAPSGETYGGGVNDAGQTVTAASSTSLVTGANSNFSSDSGYWNKLNTVTISGGNCTLGSSAGIYRYSSSLVKRGKYYGFTATISALSGTLTVGSNNTTTYLGVSSQVSTTSTGTFSGYFYADNGNFIIQVSSGGSATLTGFTIFPAGLLLAPDAAQAGGGLTWYDTSGNAANITLPASGVSWNVLSSKKTATGWTFGDEIFVGVRGVSLTSGSGAYRFSSSAYIDASGQTIRLLDSGGNLTTLNAGAGSFSSTTDSTSTSTGALTITGGVGIAKTLTTTGRILTTTVKTANYTVATTDHVVVCNSATAFTITMIAASSNTGRQFIIKNKGAGEITVDATSLGQIDGVNTIALSQYQSTILVSDGTTWNRI